MRPFISVCAGAAIVFMAGGDVALGGGLGDDHSDQEGQTFFFGVVKDTRGAAIADARVNVVFKNMSFIARTDVLGAYHISTTTDPDQTEVSCSKDGYRQTGTTRRTPSGGGKSPVEIDCILQRGGG